MITHCAAALLCRRVAERIRELAEAAEAVAPSPWRAEKGARDGDWPLDYVSAAGRRRRFRAPSEAEAAHIAAWAPPVALAVADMLELLAEQIDTAAEFEMPPPGIYLSGARVAEAFLLAQPLAPDDPEEIRRRLDKLKSQRDAGDGTP